MCLIFGHCRSKPLCTYLALPCRVVAALRAAVASDGLNIIQSSGAAATQTVPHLYVHLVLC
ncbi:HIT domain-containing protein [Corynebacterium matruchotii]|uniref:HIT domain-containing protein n=1 Tax=Corynebacterium matruchotii TaxID=43768 RepID=UPI0028E43646|nr:HIT domain-containing protein [Corynebacterium matruchotii]